MLLVLCVIGIARAAFALRCWAHTGAWGRVRRQAYSPLNFAFDVCVVGQPPVRALRLRVRAGGAAAVSPPASRPVVVTRHRCTRRAFPPAAQSTQRPFQAPAARGRGRGLKRGVGDRGERGWWRSRRVFYCSVCT